MNAFAAAFSPGTPPRSVALLPQKSHNFPFMDVLPQKQAGVPLAFLPTSREEMQALGIEQLDVIIVTGDAYVDHPAFGAAMVGRYLQSLGVTVGIIAMPNVNAPAQFAALGQPRYFFGVTAGNVDSMVSLFTAQKKPRSDDPYVPGGGAGMRPQRAVIAYCNAIRQAFSGAAIVIGGVEASLRRIVHYDFWSDSLRQPILLDAKADLLAYGMAEHPLRAIVARCKRGEPLSGMLDIPGTAVRLGKAALDAMAADPKNRFVRLPSFEEIRNSREAFSRMTRLFYENPDAAFLQESGTLAVLVNRPAEPLTQGEIDRIYELPFTYHQHPSYKQAIPAYEQIRDSITVVRGCFGGCNFCGLGAHQGKTVQSRSKESVVREIRRRSQLPGWKGIVSDLGGPTANMYGLFCKRPKDAKPCTRRSCLTPSACAFLHT
ncbi:MAG TPA: YgiQ family radical SAM protein, partial [Chitinivibrionales bacterium]|nr:YgiQ family radical SAM protein [Chitinivibrionales bacterium]